MQVPERHKEREVVGFVPKEMFFTKGVGKHREKLTSFELALRSAGIAACNLVRVSSIFPPKCRILPRSEGMKRSLPRIPTLMASPVKTSASVSPTTRLTVPAFSPSVVATGAPASMTFQETSDSSVLKPTGPRRARPGPGSRRAQCLKGHGGRAASP